MQFNSKIMAISAIMAASSVGASYGPGNHASAPAYLSRNRLMITQEERDRRNKLKRISKASKKRNRK